MRKETGMRKETADRILAGESVRDVVLEAIQPGHVLSWNESDIAEGQIEFLKEDILEHDYIFEDDDELSELAEQAGGDSKKFMELVKAAGKEKDLDKMIEDSAYSDTDIYTWAWDDLVGELSVLLKKKNPDELPWRVNMEGFGWRGQSGTKLIEKKVNDGEEFLHRILPKTDCTFYIYDKKDQGLAINNFHHDAPTGAEWYYATPEAEEPEEEE